ncbi:hypothetical protein V8B55DRAFT_1442573 [Mucor lusitanicus]|uniref:Swiss Army Knife RNA repair protein HAD domain-containing protein n=2 Tax=Mucor circinelloides f. lusitanicus TaxID=29924 RepID=A0A168K9J2_MUCCL|nr:hypothetical protein FB192DRAFT_1350818 [Mucor lusitanicus]OAD02145.1 hypothetical protein MUCCIDRAFT_82529 [Mucor lusitanicus CBS 277.49]
MSKVDDSMRMHMSDISDLEKEVLSRQLQKSPLCQAQQPTDRHITTLDIFDFDSTLFLSPLLSPNIWHSSFVNTITTENLLGPGWWRDIRSLQLHLSKDESSTPWCRFWNEDIVTQVRASMADPSHLTVLLTGRRYHPFHALMDNILASKGLVFDIVGLRPDPESDAPDHPAGFMFNHEPNVFETTMHFKTSFIVNILHHYPSLTDIVMWDDRQSHICVFQEYLARMKKLGLVQRGEMVCVVPARPKYNPEWEHKTVTSMLETHNAAVLALRHAGEPFTEPNVVIENHGQLISSANTYSLKKIDWLLVLKLPSSVTTCLRSVFEPLYRQDVVEAEAPPTWKSANAEEPVFFGNQVLLAVNTKEMASQLAQELGIVVGKELHFKVVARSVGSSEHGMCLQVQIQDARFILPLWYKPSSFNYLLVQNVDWIPSLDSVQLDESSLKGVVDYHHLLTVERLEDLCPN